MIERVAVASASAVAAGALGGGVIPTAGAQAPSTKSEVVARGPMAAAPPPTPTPAPTLQQIGAAAAAAQDRAALAAQFILDDDVDADASSVGAAGGGWGDLEEAEAEAVKFGLADALLGALVEETATEVDRVLACRERMRSRSRPSPT